MSSIGRDTYCGACSKVVVDFSLMSDGEILDVLKQLKGKQSCGSFLPTQLDRPLTDNRRSPRFVIWQRAAALLLLLQSATFSTIAQQGKKAPHTAQHAKKQPARDTSKTIKGRVLDNETRKPVSSIKITITELNSSVVTDSNGAFRFAAPQIMPDTITIQKYNAADAKGGLIEEVKIHGPAIGREIIVLRYVPEMLPQHIVHEYKKPLINRYRGGFTSGREPAGNRDINVNDIHTPRVEADRPTLWHRITHPFKKKHHD